MSHNQSKKHEAALKLALDELGVKNGMLITFDDPEASCRLTTRLFNKTTNAKAYAAGALIRLGLDLEHEAGLIISDQEFAKALRHVGVREVLVLTKRPYDMEECW